MTRNALTLTPAVMLSAANLECILSKLLKRIEFKGDIGSEHFSRSFAWLPGRAPVSEENRQARASRAQLWRQRAARKAQGEGSRQRTNRSARVITGKVKALWPGTRDSFLFLSCFRLNVYPACCTAEYLPVCCTAEYFSRAPRAKTRTKFVADAWAAAFRIAQQMRRQH
jgi:hypothetical protein